MQLSEQNILFLNKNRLNLSQIPVIEALAEICNHHTSRMAVFFPLSTPLNFPCRMSLYLC